MDPNCACKKPPFSPITREDPVFPDLPGLPNGFRWCRDAAGGLGIADPGGTCRPIPECAPRSTDTPGGGFQPPWNCETHDPVLAPCELSKIGELYAYQPLTLTTIAAGNALTNGVVLDNTAVNGTAIVGFCVGALLYAHRLTIEDVAIVVTAPGPIVIAATILGVGLEAQKQYQRDDGPFVFGWDPSRWDNAASISIKDGRCKCTDLSKLIHARGAGRILLKLGNLGAAIAPGTSFALTAGLRRDQFGIKIGTDGMGQICNPAPICGQPDLTPALGTLPGPLVVPGAVPNYPI